MFVQDASPFVLFVYWVRRWWAEVLARAAGNVAFRRAYAVGSAAVLLDTTLLWAILGARLQLHNADQLSDPYMFSSWATFHSAFFPGQHTFLLKWPVFWLVSLFGVSPASLMVATVGVVLATVAVFMAILYKIDRRPLVFGTVCLGVSLALLLIPAQPYAGGLLPVNMAMLTTRNLEYVVYLLALVCLARANRFRSFGFWLGVILLALLTASDKLFMSLSIGGSLLALAVYSLLRNWSLVVFAARWLLGSVAAAAGSVVALLIVSATHLTHLANSNAAAPYGLIHSGKDLVLGVAYAVLSVFTNAGANPAYDGTILGNVPGIAAHRLWSVTGLAYLVSGGLLLYGLFLAWRFVVSTLRAAPRQQKVPAANLLALSLLWSTVAAAGVFVATSHYYAVDARYLSIGLFALVIITSVSLRRHNWQHPEQLLRLASVLLVAIGLAVVTAFHISAKQTAALQTVDARNELVATALKHHRVDVLVGDYWRVLPIKLASHGVVTALPLTGCTQPATALTSGVWQPDLSRHSFAYLVSLDRSLTNFPQCTLGQITAHYGHPNATQIIAGTIANPTEALLFYDAGSHPTATPVAEQQTSLLPLKISQLMKTACAQPTVMNVVAHQDDDLLFLSPDLIHEIQAGNCVRTVYMTAGDAGYGKLYWISRRLGTEAAYSSMLHVNDVWDEQTVALESHEYITVATPHTNSNVSLIFLDLPDGNLQGQGFDSSHHESLAKLYNHAIAKMHSVDGQSTYNYGQLVNALSTLMALYQPTEIHTQANAPSTEYPDHSDHITAGNFTELAASQYDFQRYGSAISIPVVRYIGYPIHGYDKNVFGGDLLEKAKAFFAYGQYDGGVCRSIKACDDGTTYGFYLSRQYQQ